MSVPPPPPPPPPQAGQVHTVALLQALEERQSALQEAKHTPLDSQPPATDTSAQLASKACEIYRLQEELLQHRQKLANQEITLQELHAAVQSAKNKAQQAENDGHRYCCVVLDNE